MERRRAQLIDLVTAQPIEPSWAPLLELSELEPANARLEDLYSRWRWQWRPSDACLCGVADLAAAVAA